MVINIAHNVSYSRENLWDYSLFTSDYPVFFTNQNSWSSSKMDFSVKWIFPKKDYLTIGFFLKIRFFRKWTFLKNGFSSKIDFSKNRFFFQKWGFLANGIFLKNGYFQLKIPNLGRISELLSYFYRRNSDLWFQ